MSRAHDLGRRGEEDALKYFRTNGYCLLKRNYRVRSLQPLSEIDLIFLVLKISAPPDLWESFAFASMAAKDDVPNVLHEFVADQFPHLQIVFVEVKCWNAYPIADLCYSFNMDRQRRMFCTAQCFLQQYPYFADLSRRFDLIIFQNNGEMQHIEAAFP